MEARGRPTRIPGLRAWLHDKARAGASPWRGFRPHPGWVLIACFAISPANAQAADVYRCITESGCVEYSDQPCDGGERIRIQESTSHNHEASSSQSHGSAKAYNEGLKVRLEAKKLERDKKQLESKRRALITERDRELSRLQEQKDATSDPLLKRKLALDIVAARLHFKQLIDAMDKQVLIKQLAIGRLLSSHDVAHRRPSSNVLDRASWGDCRAFIEGDETARTLRLRGEGFAGDLAVDVIHKTGDKETERAVPVSKSGCFELILLPRQASGQQGKASVTIRGAKCSLRLNYSWRRP